MGWKIVLKKLGRLFCGLEFLEMEYCSLAKLVNVDFSYFRIDTVHPAVQMIAHM